MAIIAAPAAHLRSVLIVTLSPSFDGLRLRHPHYASLIRPTEPPVPGETVNRTPQERERATGSFDGIDQHRLVGLTGSGEIACSYCKNQPQSARVVERQPENSKSAVGVSSAAFNPNLAAPFTGHKKIIFMGDIEIICLYNLF
jgi:hypothetical protein